MKKRALVIVLAALAAAGCQPKMLSAPARIITQHAEVVGETQAVLSDKDAADDPAIWRNEADPANSLIVATDKQVGLYVYGLDGKIRSFVQAGRVNNVDLRDLGEGGVIVGASDRTDLANGKIALFKLDTASARLVPLGEVASGSGEAYGFCLWRRAADKALFGFVVFKDGAISQVALDLSGAAPAGKIVRTMKLATQAEGCVVDDRTGRLYVAEEDVGLWRFGAEPTAPATPEPFAKVDGARLFDDAEGLALAKVGADGGYLIASSQGDNAYALFALPDGAFKGRFRLTPNGKVGGTSDTDGVELALGDFGPDYPGGLFIAQDGDNAPFAQNFKLTAWATILKALGL